MSLKDVNVDDRVVLDVEKKTSVATELKLVVAAHSTATATAPAGKRKG